MAASAVRPTSVRWRILALMMLYTAIAQFARNAVPVAGDEIFIRLFHVDTKLMGWVYTTFLIFYSLAMTPGGMLIDRFGTRITMAAMGFANALTTALAGATALVAHGGLLVSLFIARAIGGIGDAPLHPGAARVVNQWFPLSKASMANGLVTGGALVGIALAPTLFGSMMDALTWPLAFVATGAAMSVVAAVWLYYGRDRPSTHTAVNEAEKRLIESQPPEVRDDIKPPALSKKARTTVFLLACSYGAVGYVQYLFFYWLKFYLREVLHVEKVASRNFTTASLFAMAAGMVIGGIVSDRAAMVMGLKRGRALVPVVGLLGSAVFVGLGLLASQVLWVVIAFSIAMAFVGATEGPFWTTSTEVGGRRAGLTASFLNTGGNIGGLLAPVVTPYFSDAFSWRASIGLAGVFAVIGALLWVWIDPTERL
jgi:ACS family D-galactonate transporter-like MFS transporter